MPDHVTLDLARVEARLGHFVLQMIGFEQEIARLKAENAELIAQLAALDQPKGPRPVDDVA